MDINLDTLSRTLHRRGLLATVAGGFFALRAGITRANHEPIPQPGAVPGAIPTLVTAYNGLAVDEAAIANIARYRPRQFTVGTVVGDSSTGNWKISNTGIWNGWDIFNFANRGSTRARDAVQFASFTLSRPAVVGLVWRGTFVPNWLASQGWVKAAQSVTVTWTTGANPKTYPVYTKAFPAGTFWVHGPYDTGECTAANGICTAADVSPLDFPTNLPFVLFGEANGTPSASPVLPAGQSVVPVPNQTCPDWVHDLYQATGPDGALYRTWHDSIDPIYWCYFRHEHGSSPRNAYTDGSFTPFYGYVAAKSGMIENHWGHKGHAFQVQDSTGYWFYITQHFGTTGVARANTCLQRHHLVDLQIRNAARTETLMHVQFMGDYGRAITAQANDGGGANYTPTACPTGSADTGITGTQNARQIPLAPFESYEPWGLSTTKYGLLGLSGSFTVNTTDAIDICPNITCDTPQHSTVGTGTARLLVFLNFLVNAPNHSADGVFYTDPMAQALVSPTAPNAIRQYVKPGFSYSAINSNIVTPTLGHWGGTRWGGPMHATAGGAPEDPEGSIRETLGPN